MAKVKTVQTSGIKIRKASTESSEKRVVGLVEDSYLPANSKNGERIPTLAVLVNEVPIRGLSFGAGKWELLCEVFADGGIDVIREWCRKNKRD